MPRLYQLFKTIKPKLEEESNITINVGSELQKKDIEDRAYSKLDGHLKKSLNNYRITLNIIITKTEQQKNLVYTQTDKFNYLVEKNEKLNDLKQKFGLDFE